MRADNEEHYREESRPNRPPVVTLVAAILALTAAGYWYFTPEQAIEAPRIPSEATPTAAEEPALPAEPEPEPTPDIPETAPVTPVATEPNQPPPPPPLALEQSDPVVRDVLQPVFAGGQLSPALQPDNLLERTVALIDLTRQGRVEPKLFPLPRPEGKFAVIVEGDRLFIDPAGYRRYDGYAMAISALDSQLLATSFHRFRPLLEEAWAALGYKADHLDNSLIKALDQVIEAPRLNQPPALVKDVTTYNFEDENLEALSPLAKQLIRMGPENQALVQAQARAIRAALLQQ